MINNSEPIGITSVHTPSLKINIYSVLNIINYYMTMDNDITICIRLYLFDLGITMDKYNINVNEAQLLPQT